MGAVKWRRGPPPRGPLGRSRGQLAPGWGPGEAQAGEGAAPGPPAPLGPRTPPGPAPMPCSRRAQPPLQLFLHRLQVILYRIRTPGAQPRTRPPAWHAPGWRGHSGTQTWARDCGAGHHAEAGVALHQAVHTGEPTHTKRSPRRWWRALGLGDFGQLRAFGDRRSTEREADRDVSPSALALKAVTPARGPGPPAAGAPVSAPAAHTPRPFLQLPDPHLGHLRPEVDVLKVDGAGGEVVQQLAQQDAVAQRLRQVEDYRRGPHDAVVGRQDLAVDEPATALPPLLHGARGARALAAAAAGPARSGQRSSQSAVAAGHPARPRRGSAAGAGLCSGGPGSPLRGRAALLFLLLLLRLVAGRRSRPRAATGHSRGSVPGPPFTHTSPFGLRPGLHASCRRSAPRSAPLGAAFCARGASLRSPLLPHPRQRRSGSLAPCVRRQSCPRRRRFVRPARGLYPTRGAPGL